MKIGDRLFGALATLQLLLVLALVAGYQVACGVSHSCDVSLFVDVD